MKFMVSKKLSENPTMRTTLIWMLSALLVGLVLSAAAKIDEYGSSPVQWSATVLGSEADFIEPLGFDELLLRVHADLFALIFIFITLGGLIMRLGYSTRMKVALMALSLITLLLYPALLLSPWIGTTAVSAGIGGVVAFHLLMGYIALIIAYGLWKRKI